ncbi:DUF2306 domain-containing protein [Paenibacillus sp. SC116]|uniref:DUF2306 domain-containing protein n=1 Tax=Paenibacillus sp. SC116 TaxID=2968986 RepID=UPI00215ABFDA|nr:DUF2306 domain-containing protein [Paenibacillus sp. SC116]MCR8845619.1 DUF2306 domain-containing protein [Paenibacillus sp. SC116]
MLKGKSFYTVLVLVSFGIIAYVSYINFIHDPRAEEFLNHKEGLKRPLQLPIWLNVMYIHVVFACIALVSGLLNFSTWLLHNNRKFHRVNGYIYVVSVFMVALTSGYMAPYSTGGKASSIAFNMLNIIWPFMTGMAIISIRKKRLLQHRKWMIRSFAYCFTNTFIHLITFVIHKGLGLAYVSSYTISIYCALIILPILAEIVIRITLPRSERTAVKQ